MVPERKNFSAASASLARSAAEIVAAAGGREPAARVLSVQAQIDAIARGDLSAALAAAHPDIQLEIFAPPEFPWIRRARGLEELRRAIAHNFGTVENQTPEIHNVMAQEDSVVLFGRERGFIPSIASHYDVQFVERFTFVDGRLASVRIVAAVSDVP